MRTRSDELLETLNEIIAASLPFTLGSINRVIEPCGEINFVVLEKEYPKFGIRLKDRKDKQSTAVTSTVALMATITDILCDERLAWISDDDTGFVTGVKWYE